MIELTVTVVLVELELVEVLVVISGVVLEVYLLIQTAEEKLITQLDANNHRR